MGLTERRVTCSAARRSWGSFVASVAGHQEQAGVAEEARTRGFAAPGFGRVCLCRGMARLSYEQVLALSSTPASKAAELHLLWNNSHRPSPCVYVRLLILYHTVSGR